MKAVKVNDVQLSEDTLRSLFLLQEDNNAYLDSTIDDLDDCVSFFADAGLEKLPKEEAFDYITHLNGIRKILKSLKAGGKEADNE